MGHFNTAIKGNFTPALTGNTPGRQGSFLTDGGSSPPRAWGTLLQLPPESAPRTVHPHARGEHPAPPPIHDSLYGSSPRASGTQSGVSAFAPMKRFIPRHLCGVTSARFIPTRVGNTAAHARAGCALTVHPHARGEHSPDRLASFRNDGSSHARGEHWEMKNDMTGPDGSSPRAWGTPRLPGRGVMASPVHPHARGEHCFCASNSGNSTGHPHARGEHLDRLRPVERLVGSFPTRVGNTRLRPPCIWKASGSSPRAWGNTSKSQCPLICRAGSSPRAWGTLLPLLPHFPRCRFIPTRVGNTRVAVR